TRVSVASDGTQANGETLQPTISANGRYVTFDSLASNLVSGDTNGKYDVFVHDMLTGSTSRISVASDGTEGNNDSDTPSINADGRYVEFASRASNIVSNDSNGVDDLFVHDMLTGSTTRVSVASDGTEANDYSATQTSISSDGRYVTFKSLASNLVS